MPDVEGANHDLNEIRFARAKLGKGGAQRRQQLAVDSSAPLETEQVDADRAIFARRVAAAQEGGTRGHILFMARQFEQRRYTGVGRRKQMVVNLARAAAVK